MRSVLVAGDTSVRAGHAIRVAVRLAEQAGSSLHVLRVDGRSGPGEPGMSDAEVLAALAGSPAPSTLERCGAPLREALAGRCREGEYDLLVLASSAADGSLDPEVVQVALHVPGDILVVRKSIHWPPRRILVPVGRADLRRRVLARALGWLARWRPDPRGGTTDAGRAGMVVQALALTTATSAAREIVPGIERQLTAIDPRLVDAAGIEIRRRIRPLADAGRPGGFRAETDGADLVVLGRHEPAPSPAEPGELAWLRFLFSTRTAVLLLARGATSSRAAHGGEVALTGRAP